MNRPDPDLIRAQLLAGGFPRGPEVQRLSDPQVDTPMVVTLDQLRPYEHNPRLVRNPLYEALKASIRERGLDQPPPITRRPGEAHFILRSGGNTRLAILNELWQATRDERFLRIHCLFRPWVDEASALGGHLVENELHGRLTFVERALAVAKLKDFFEAEGQPLSQRELARRLTAIGYAVSQPHLSRLFDTLAHLLPALPNALYAGLGKPQVERLLGLRRHAEQLWLQHAPAAEGFQECWFATLADCDAPPDALDPEALQQRLLQRMAKALNRPYRLLLAPAQSPGAEAPAPSATPPAGASDTTPAPEEPRPEQAPSGSTSPRVRQIQAQITRAVGADEAPDATAQVDTPTTLRPAIFVQAQRLAAYAEMAETVLASEDGLGFRLDPTRTPQTPRALSIQLLLTALLRAQDEADWTDRQHLPAALFGQLLLGVYQISLGARPAQDIGLERLPDAQLDDLLALIRLARRLVDVLLPLT